MIRSLHCTQDGKVRTDLTVDEYTTALQDESDVLWVDFTGEPPEVCEPILRQTFAFHPLAVDDALQESHVPKVDDWGNYLYLVLHAIALDRHNPEYIDTLELDIFLGSNYIVTHHDQPIHAVDRVWESWHRDERRLKKGADHLLYLIADELVAGYMPVVEEIDQAIDEIEDRIFHKPRNPILEQLFGIKRGLLHVRRVLTPQREVINKLARDDYAVIDADDRVFFRDIYDHLVRLHDINDSLRDLATGALDIYLSTVNNRMNEVMKILTIITTIFMPISFVAGFLGMNFFASDLVLNDWAGGGLLLLTTAVMVFISVSLYFWIRARAWM
jgi:magnesium transporter